jgi:hypothetical protein
MKTGFFVTPRARRVDPAARIVAPTTLRLGDLREWWRAVP